MEEIANSDGSDTLKFPSMYESFKLTIGTLRSSNNEIAPEDVRLLFNESMKSLDSLNNRRIELDKMYWALSSAAAIAASYSYIHEQLRPLVAPALGFGLIVSLAWISTQVHHDFIRDRKQAVVCMIEAYLPLAPMRAEVYLTSDAVKQYWHHCLRYSATAIPGILVMLMFFFLLLLSSK